jgi:hypothetical protein
MSLSIAYLPDRPLPETRRRNAFATVDSSLRQALAARIDAPFWFDTTRYPAYVDIRVQQPQGVLRVIAPRERAVATQAHIFVLWLTIATVLLMGVAILFIRNQVRAIERLADAAEACTGAIATDRQVNRIGVAIDADGRAPEGGGQMSETGIESDDHLGACQQAGGIQHRQERRNDRFGLDRRRRCCAMGGQPTD